jgi:hypothetical protein
MIDFFNEIVPIPWREEEEQLVATPITNHRPEMESCS